jgi:hypothetical protein
MTTLEQTLTEIFIDIVRNNKRHLSQSIEDFNVLLTSKPEVALHNLSMLSKEDQQTPGQIIEVMIDLMSWRNEDGSLDTTKIYVDPCCGRGNILAYLHSHYNIPKDNLFGIDIKQANVTLCNKLGFNVIQGDALNKDTYLNLNQLIQKIKGVPMKPERVLMNPPYNKTQHLQILETVHDNTPADCEIANISPIGWLENPTLEASKSPFKRFTKTVLPHMNKLLCIDATTACKVFKIEGGVDLGIYVFNGTSNKIEVLSSLAQSCINKICFTGGTTLKQKCTSGVSGWRCEVKELTFGAGGHNQGNAESSKQCAVKLVLGPYKDGYDTNGKFFTETRQKNQNTKDWFKSSIEFTSETEATNFYLSCTTNFYKRLIQLLNVNGDPQHAFLPYMDDYSKAWTDEDYCKFFGLNEEESEFMCRTIDDYRVKDFINYINLDEE